MTFAVTYPVSYVAMCTHNQVFHNTLSFIARAAFPTQAPFPIMFVLLSSRSLQALVSARTRRRSRTQLIRRQASYRAHTKLLTTNFAGPRSTIIFSHQSQQLPNCFPACFSSCLLEFKTYIRLCFSSTQNHPVLLIWSRANVQVSLGPQRTPKCKSLQSTGSLVAPLAH